MRHNEPVLTLGISDADIAAYVDGFRGHDMSRPAAESQDLPEVISRATISTGVIRDGIMRTARVLAAAEALGLRGLIFTDPARCRAHLIAQGLLPA